MGEKNKILARYILPSAGGLCVTYLYNIVDGIFVGRGVGALALAAVNITVPFITTLVAISTLFAMGGSTVIAIRLGRGDKRGANDAFMTALVLTLLLSVLLLIANIFLDWLFIFPIKMGIMGAAVASGLGQLLSFMILISHFIRKRGDLRICRYKCSFTLAKKICNRGVPECFTQLNTPVTAFCYNWVLAGTLGDMGVATFSVLSFIYSLANAILSGVAQGLQPLWGQAFGKNDKGELKSDFLAGMKINLLVSVIIYVILVVFRIPVVRLFNSEAELVEMASGALPVFALSFLFMAVNLIFTAYFYSTKQTWKSNIIAVSRGIIVKAAAIFLVSM